MIIPRLTEFTIKTRIRYMASVMKMPSQIYLVSMLYK